MSWKNGQAQRGDREFKTKYEVNIKRRNMNCQSTRNTWKKK